MRCDVLNVGMGSKERVSLWLITLKDSCCSQGFNLSECMWLLAQQERKKFDIEVLSWGHHFVNLCYGRITHITGENFVKNVKLILNRCFNINSKRENGFRPFTNNRRAKDLNAKLNKTRHTQRHLPPAALKWLNCLSNSKVYLNKSAMKINANAWTDSSSVTLTIHITKTKINQMFYFFSVWQNCLDSRSENLNTPEIHSRTSHHFFVQRLIFPIVQQRAFREVFFSLFQREMLSDWFIPAS